jgi:hypothetical protein
LAAEKKRGADDVNGAGEPEDKRLTDSKHGEWPVANDRDARIASLQGHKDRSEEVKPPRTPPVGPRRLSSRRPALHFVAARVILPSMFSRKAAYGSRRLGSYRQSTAPHDLQHHEVGRRLRRHPSKVPAIERP